MAGIDVLKAGGNAIDAAIAANAMLSLVEPMSCGPGGDLFAIVWSEKDQKLFGLNASGRSPYDWNLAAGPRPGPRRKSRVYSPLSWSVPGCVSGWDALHKRFGKLPLRPAPGAGDRATPGRAFLSRRSSPPGGSSRARTPTGRD